MDLSLDLAALDTGAHAAIIVAAIAMLVRAVGWALRERATAHRLAQQAALERAKAELELAQARRAGEETTGRHVVAQHEAERAYRELAQHELGDLREQLGERDLELDTLRGELAAAQEEIDRLRGRFRADNTPTE